MEDNVAVLYDTNELNQYVSVSENGAAAFEPQFDADGNQTLIKTSTGIWSTVYNAENRPVSFTNADTGTVVECAYDSTGRRAYKKVIVNGSIALHQRYIYRAYLQIGCVDLTRSHHPALWYITWDPTQPIVTRPLAIQKDGTWYTYGLDLAKNVFEVFSSSGYITTAYAYSPYGAVTSSGSVTQPILWSSEVWDDILGMTYYNYRHYNGDDGRWICRDKLMEASNPNLYNYIPYDTLGLGKIKLIAYIVRRVTSRGLARVKKLYTDKEILRALEQKKDVYFVEGRHAAKRAIKRIRKRDVFMKHGYNKIRDGQYRHFHGTKAEDHAHAFYGNPKTMMIVAAGSTLPADAEECWGVHVEEEVSDIPQNEFAQYTLSYYEDSTLNNILDFFNPASDISDLYEIITPEPVCVGYKITVTDKTNRLVAEFTVNENLEMRDVSLGIGAMDMMNSIAAESDDQRFGTIFDTAVYNIMNGIGAIVD